MKIGCLCVTENRIEIYGIGLASFLVQDYENKEILTVCNQKEYKQYHQKYKEVAQKEDNPFLITELEGPKTVTKRLDLGCNYLFNKRDCDAVAVWDDDDYKLTNLLNKASKILSEDVWITGYESGYYVDLKTLETQFIKDDPIWGYWGGSMVFTKTAWENQKIASLQWLGWDRRFAESVPKKHWGEPVSKDPGVFAVCHTKNACQHMREGMHRSLGYGVGTVFPRKVLAQVLKAQENVYRR